MEFKEIRLEVNMIIKLGRKGGLESFHYVASIYTISASCKRFSIHSLNFSCEDIWTNISLSLIFFDESVNCPSLQILCF